MENKRKFKLFSISVIIATTTMVAGVKAFEYQNEYKNDSLNTEIVGTDLGNTEQIIQSEENSLTNEKINQEKNIPNKEEIINSDVNDELPGNEEIIGEDLSKETDIIEEPNDINEMILEEEINSEETILEENTENTMNLMPASLPTTYPMLSGELSLNAHKPIDFGTHQIERKKKIVTTGFEGDFTVIDARGTQDGWELKVSATPFTIAEPESGWLEYNPYQLPVGSLTLSSLTNVYGFNYQLSEVLVEPNSSEENSEIISEPLGISLVEATDDITPSINMIDSAIDMGEFVTVAIAGAGQGMGEYILQYNMNALNLVIDPITAKVDRVNYPNGVTPYESTITWNLISGPSSGIVPNSINPYSLVPESSIDENKKEDNIEENDDIVNKEEVSNENEATTPLLEEELNKEELNKDEIETIGDVDSETIKEENEQTNTDSSNKESGDSETIIPEAIIPKEETISENTST